MTRLIYHCIFENTNVTHVKGIDNVRITSLFKKTLFFEIHFKKLTDPEQNSCKYIYEKFYLWGAQWLSGRV